jgi:hypothetical protein
MMSKRREYAYSTPEGFTVKVELTNEGLEDERIVQDWSIGFSPSAGYDVDDVDHYSSGLEIKTSREPERGLIG